ncbi:hypothetical protein EJB05_36741, partial [Eragrostis curvula]
MAPVRSRLLLLCLTIAAADVLQARAQTDSIGFISIDCGLPGTASYLGDTVNVTYVPDAAFIDTGTNRNISAAYVTPTISKLYLTVRSFPNGTRNCYTLPTANSGHKFLLRAMFKYGNYDGLNRPPVFDLYVGVNWWTTVNVTNADTLVMAEAIVVVPDDFVQVCLVNTGTGTPFISVLELRPLKSTLYPQANETLGQGLVLVGRLSFGQTGIVRYPDDIHDRIWLPWADATKWDNISTTQRVNLFEDDNIFEAPSKVMQTAITPRNASKIDFYWVSEPQPKDPTPRYIANLYFAELQLLPTNVVRQFYVNLNGKLWYSKAYTPPYLTADYIYNENPLRDNPRYNFSLDATANSTLPPIINAVEVFSVISTANVATDPDDVSAITAIKAAYHVQKNWAGDPCVPKNFAWDGLTCSFTISSRPRITGVNMSYTGLNGNISSSFANLKAVQYLDLSHNNLSGTIPDSLSQLSSLTVLDLTGNQLSGSIPSGLLKRTQDGSLSIRYGDNPNLCTNPDSCQITKGKSKLAIYIAIPVVLLVVIASVVSSLSSLQLENRRFTYKELEMITNNFQRVLGQGGFGYVYHGLLEDGTQVAVKLRSHSSNQGVKEFLAEAQILTRIHHKNLVSMIGYCKDGEYLALVYEYMPEGTLQEHIAGNSRNGILLTWRQRLKIALESAQGLEYLHRGCNPPLVHRDVKATNILLNSKLEAKIADFGLSKAFNLDNDTHISTNSLVGTPGYVDPEYQATMQPTTKSDVYSFGVVLLELVTGRPAILRDPAPISINHWSRQRLARGNIENVVDQHMRGDHDINGVWKVADLALKCTAMASTQRPTMTDVVAQLQECLELEEARGGEVNNNFDNDSSSSGRYKGYNAYTTSHDQYTDVSPNSSAFDMEHNFGRLPTAAAGVLRVHGQDIPDSKAFISIDCGLPEESSYVDPVTNLTYVSDTGFTDAGVNRNVSAEYIKPTTSQSARFRNVRSFPGAAPRSCYTLGSLNPGSKYLVRGTFMYGNYDGLNRLPVFDLYLGVNFWTTMNITTPDDAVLAEVIAVVPDDSVQVCLVNTGAGTPFISALDLRPLKNTLYPLANATQGLVLYSRRNLGPSLSERPVVRYPDDRYDRVWTQWMEPDTWSEISTTEKMQSTASLYFDVPSAVMQTAITPLKASNNIELWVYVEPNHVYTAPGYIFILYFTEVQVLSSNATRQFYITINGKLWYPGPYTPQYLLSDAVYSKGPQYGFSQYNITLSATANSTLPPIINAVETFSVISTANVGTDAQDGRYFLL